MVSAARSIRVRLEEETDPKTLQISSDLWGVCVSGEPGLGKTTLVEKFLAEASDATIASGRCSESLAGSETYLPMFEALSDLLRAGGLEAAADVDDDVFAC